MKKLSKLILIPAILVLACLILPCSLNLNAQAGTVDAFTEYSNNNGWIQLALNSKNSSPQDLVTDKDKGLPELPLACYGPHITANISKNEINVGETVTIMGRICPPEPNTTIRVTFTRPDYTWIDQFVLTEDETGEFVVTQVLDTPGYWNIFPINGHICDRLYANVTNPEDPQAPLPLPNLPPFKLNYSVFGATVIAVSLGVVTLAAGMKNKTRKISSLRLFVQIGVVCLIFAGIFVDHQNIPVPAEQIAPHEFLVGTNSLGIEMPDGLPAPFFSCYFPCGRTSTCALWQMQTYIYPFWDAGRGWGVNYAAPGIERLAIVFGVVIVASIILGRWWCGWICPFGLYVDVVSRIRKYLGIKHRNLSPNFNAKFHQLSYVIMALMLILSVFFASEVLAGSQLIPGTEEGGLVYQYFSAPFCQVCPMKPLCVISQTGLGAMRVEWIVGPTRGDFYQLGFYITSINLLILGVVTVAAFFVRRSWCRICPLGGFIALFNRFRPFKWISGVRLEKDEEKCTKCGICKRVCPTQVTEVYEEKGGDVTTSQCLLCLRCVEMCPYEDCLKFKFGGKTVFKSRDWLNKKSDINKLGDE